MNSPAIDGPRACTPGERPEVVALVDQAMRQGTGQSMLTDYPRVYRDGNLANVFVLRAGGELASVVPFIPHEVRCADCRFTIGIISPTATAPQHRKQGYAGRCLDACHQQMARLGIPLSVLWTKVETFPFYEKGGYQAVRSQGWTYRCDGADASRFHDHGQAVITYQPETGCFLPEIQALHEQAVYGVFRPAEAYSTLFSLPRMTTLLALENGRPAAYLTVSRAINKPGLLEAGGSGAAVETLVHHALATLDAGESMTAYANLAPTVLEEVVAAKLPDRRQPQTAGPMMIRINDAAGFVATLSPWLQRQHPTVDPARLAALPPLSLAALLFGAHPERPVAPPAELAAFTPFHFPIWMLDHS